MADDNRRKDDENLKEIKESIEKMASSFLSLSNKQIEIAVNSKNTANMVNEYNKENKDQHKTFYQTDDKVIELKTQFNEHRGDHETSKENKRDNKSLFAIIISACVFMFLVLKSVLAHFTSSHPPHN